MTDRLLLTIPEAAEALSVSERSLRTMISRGQIVAVHLGRSVRVARVTLDAFVASRVAEAEQSLSLERGA